MGVERVDYYSDEEYEHAYGMEQSQQQEPEVVPCYACGCRMYQVCNEPVGNICEQCGKLPILYFALKAEYFDAIKAGTKQYEYRLNSPYWRKRLYGKQFSKIVITKGYPKKDDKERRIERPWLGYTRTRIKHPHFGDKAVNVFAIKVN